MTGATLTVSSFRAYSGKGTYLTLGGYGSTGTFAQNEAVHSATVSATVAASILSFSGGTISLTVNTTQASSGNQLNFRESCVLTLTVHYAETATSSTGSLSKTTAAIGDSISLTINPSSGTVSHRVVWSLGSYSTPFTIPAGGSICSFIIPETWANAISGSTATAYATLHTLDSWGTQIGSTYYTFTVTLAGAASPTIGSFTATRVDGDVPAGWGVYVQGKSKVMLTITGAAGSLGSSISSYKFSGGGYSWSSSGENSYMTGFLSVAGDVTFTATVTDTRNNTATKTLTIHVMEYAPPALTSVNGFRCQENGTASETGGYLAVRVAATFTSLDGKNKQMMAVQYRQIGTDEWALAVSLVNGEQKIINAGFTGANRYEFYVIAIDEFASITRTADVAAAQYTMHMATGGLNVSFGKAGKRPNAVEISEDWKLYHGDTDVLAAIGGTGGTVPITKGGTGATTAAGALTNLGAAPAVHNHSADSITAGVLAVARGGTGTSALTASRAVMTTATGTLTTANVTAAQLGYLSDVTRNIQMQLDSKSSLKLAHGTATIDGNNAAYINYSSAAFMYMPYVVATYCTTGANWSGDNGAIKIYFKTTTSAQIIVGGSFSSPRTIDWIALGW